MLITQNFSMLHTQNCLILITPKCLMLLLQKCLMLIIKKCSLFNEILYLIHVIDFNLQGITLDKSRKLLSNYFVKQLL